MTGSLVDNYDAALFDLDGVVYLGPHAVPAAPDTITQLRSRRVKVGFVTNNAARSADVVAEHLTALGIPAEPSDVVTSAQAITDIAARELPAGARVLVVGTDSLAQEASARGLVPVASVDDGPVAVIQGYDPHIDWTLLEEAGFSLQRGAKWYAANPDLTRPTDRGIVPGIGAQLQVVATTCSVEPVIAGKPYRPLLQATLERLGCSAPVFVGDRLDTDVRGARAIGMDSLFVFTGAHGVHDLLDADPGDRPDHLAADLSGLIEPRRDVTVSDGRATCREATAVVRDGRVVVEDVPTDLSGQLDAMTAILALSAAEEVPGDHDVVGRFDHLH